ncbi:MAG: hypothetical protein OXF88_20695 [Rhodobacteraceae bacterium]|nr:hypothetical protein [Paracoccaceae bacterium]MCY4139779.1 hypothetical protein [Paracoccaceae bacterium]
MKRCRFLLATSALVALSPLVATPTAALELDFGGYFTDFEGLSRDRAAEMYAFALQRVAGEYLDAISADHTRALLNLLEAAGTALPGGQGPIPSENARRLSALGLQAAAADGQLAVWIPGRSLRSGAKGIDVELAAQRLHLAMVGRIRDTAFHRDGVPPEAINPALASIIPDAAVGVVLSISSPADILAEDPDATAHRRRPCPDGQHGFGIQETRRYVRRLRGYGQAETEWAGPWREVARNCMNEHTREVVTAAPCPAPEPGFIFYRIEQRVQKHPDDPYGFRIWRQPTGPSNEISRTCGIKGKRLETSSHKETGTRDRPCTDVYTPWNPPRPPYGGTVSESRGIQVLSSWFAGEEEDALERRYFGAWNQTGHTCSRDLTRTVERRRQRICPASFPKGDSQEEETGIQTYRDFPDRADAIVSVAWQDDWKVVLNNCHKTWTQAGTPVTHTQGCSRYSRPVTLHYAAWERDGGTAVLQRTERGASTYAGAVSGCSTNSSNGGNGGGGNDREDPNHGIDTDGDGVADYHSPEHAEQVTGERPDDYQNIHDGCSSSTCSGPTNNDRDDDTGGGGGPCWLTTAVVEMRGEADNGPTLAALREFRDGWLSSTPEGRKLIADYYAVAPRITSAIPEDHADWEWIANRVETARSAIAAGNNHVALTIYAEMVRDLQDRWLRGGQGKRE